jgi:hypothetical protein
LAHAARCAAVGKTAISAPSSPDGLLGADRSGAGHRIQLGDLGRERGDLVLDRCGQLLDPAGQLVGALGRHPAEEPVVVVEVPGQGLLELAELGAHARPGASWASTLGSRCPATIAWSTCRPDTPKTSLATLDSLVWASSGSFSTRWVSRVRSRVSVRR